MAEDVAHGVVRIELDDSQLDAGLRRAEAEFDRTMADIGRKRAQANVELDLKKLEREVAEAKGLVKQLEGKQAEVDLGLETGDFKKDIAVAKLWLKELEGQQVDVKLELTGRKEAAAELAAFDKTLEAQAKAQERRDAALLRAEDRHRRAIRERGVMESRAYAEDLRRTRERGLLEVRAHNENMARDKAAYDLEIKRQKLADSIPLKMAQARAQVAKLSNDYAKVTREIERIEKRPLPVGWGSKGREARVEVTVEAAHAYEKLELIKAKLNALGAHPPAHIKVDANFKDRTLSSIGRVIDKFSKIGDASIRLGPFTSSIRGAIAASAALGPIITSLLGSATSLVGVLGTGIAGAASIGGAALLGFGQAGLGVFFGLKPIVAEYQKLNTISGAVTTATLKYGAGSKQAVKAQQQMNQALKGVSPATRDAFNSLTKLRTEWHKLTDAPLRRSFGHVVAEGVKTATALMPQFASRTKQTFDVLDKGLSKWTKGLRGPEAKGILDTTFGNANAALGPLMHGLGQLATWFGRVAQSASRFLQPMAQGFDKWASGLAGAVSNTGRLDGQVDRLAGHARDVIHWFASLGRLLITVFNGSANAGDKMANSMSDAFDRWNEFLKSPKGAQDMATFFDRARKGATELVHALTPVVKAFIGLSDNLTPWVAGILKGIGAVGNLANKVLSLTALRGPIAALGFTIGAAFSISKIGHFVAIISNLVTLLKEANAAATFAGGLKIFTGGLSRKRGGSLLAGSEIEGAMAAGGAQAAGLIEAAMLTGGERAAAMMAGGETIGGVVAGGEEALALKRATAAGGVAIGGEKIAATAGQATLGARAMTGLAAAATGAGEAIGLVGTAATVAGTVGIGALVAAAGFGIYKLATMKHSASEATKEFKALRTGTHNLARDTSDWAQNAAQAPKALRDQQKATHDLGKEEAKLDAIRKKYGSNSKQFRDQLINVNNAINANNAAHRRSQDIIARDNKLDGVIQQRRTAAGRAHSTVATAQRELQDARKLAAAQTAGLPPAQRAKAIIDATADAQRRLDGVRRSSALIARQLEHAENSKASVQANSARVLLGLQAAEGIQQQRLGRLARQAPVLAKTIGTHYYDPAEAGRVAANASKALSGKASITTVNKIVADSSDADQAIARLQAARITTQWRVVEHGGAAAERVLSRLAGRKLTRHEMKIAHAGGPQALAMIGKVRGAKIPPKTVHVGADVGGALAGIDAVGRAISSLDGKTANVFVKKHGSVFAHGGGGSYGDGAGADHVTARASMLADKRPIRRAADVGRISTPTYLVGEENMSEYVISTNPAYRRRNRGIVAEAAGSLGMHVIAAKGGVSRRAKPTPHPGLPGSIQTLPVPEPYSAGAIDESAAQTAVDAWKQERSRRLTARANLKKRLAKAEKRTAKTKDAKKSKADEIKSIKHDLGLLSNGDPSAQDGIRQVSMGDIRKAVGTGQAELGKLKRANARIVSLNAMIETDRSIMELQSKIFSDPNSSVQQRSVAKKAYGQHRTRRLSEIGSLKTRLNAAAQAAEMLLGLSPNSTTLKATLDRIRGDLATADTQQYDASQEPADLGGGSAKTADDFISEKGLTTKLKDLLYAESVAKTTPNDLKDDESARISLHDFYASLISLAGPKTAENVDVLTELNDRLSSYNEPGNTGDTSQADAITAQTAARMSAQLRGDLVDSAVIGAFRGNGNFGGNALLQSYFGAPVSSVGPRSMSVADATAGPVARSGGTPTGGTTVNINALTANPRDALQAANTIVGGLGYQGGRPASSTRISA